MDDNNDGTADDSHAQVEENNDDTDMLTEEVQEAPAVTNVATDGDAEDLCETANVPNENSSISAVIKPKQTPTKWIAV